jgi:putative membrane protein
MKLKFLFAPAAALAAAACGGDTANENAGDADAGMMDNMPMDNLVMNGDANAMAPDAAAAAISAADFAAQAAGSDLFEIESGKLAGQKAQNADVKAFAGMLVADHEEATADLKAAAAKGQPAIAVTPVLDADQQANIQALRAASGADFDKLFLSQQILAHEKALGLVQGYASAGDVDALKQHASTAAGPIQKHLDRAKQLQDQIGR